MRLRKPCEHIDEMHPYGHYVEHEVKCRTCDGGDIDTGCSVCHGSGFLICPGGEFLPEDALVLVKVDDRELWRAVKRFIEKWYDPDQVGEPG